MGNTLSVEDKLYKAAKNGDVSEVRGIIGQLKRQNINLRPYLNYEGDTSGSTPLINACARGYYATADLLLQNGADLHKLTRHPERNTALHMAVDRGHQQIAELLLQYGANPFLENGRGLTCVDIAINRGNVNILRALELRSDFTGTILLKIPKYLGLGAEWKARWTVIMPRYQMTGQGQETLSRSLLVFYKDPYQCVPSCKVWLDGAIARQVVGSRGSTVLQCALSLHKNHALAQGAHMTGDPSVGYTMHLRPADGGQQSNIAMRRFMDIVNAARSPSQAGPSGSANTQASHPPSRTQTPHTPYYTAPQTPVDSPHASRSTETDAEMARRLQAQYDAELAEAKLPQPAYNLGDRTSQPYASVSGTGLQPPATSFEGHTHGPSHSHTPSASSLHSIPSAPMYPTIDPTISAQNTAASQANPGARPPAGVPPNSATLPTAVSHITQSPEHEAAAKADDDDDVGMCVICMSEPASAGFLHGESVHKCCCKECAQDIKKRPNSTCPMCRQPIQHVILNFY